MKILDLTNLDPFAKTADIIGLCDTAKKHSQYVAGVCVFPEYISLVKQNLIDTNIKTVTVVNFPYGINDLYISVGETIEAIKLDADEIDLVINWQRYNEKSEGIFDTVYNVRDVCKGKVLKVILETGCLRSNLWKRAAVEAIAGGADFLKTSTGKVEVGATLEAAKTLAETIYIYNHYLNKNIGLKVSGGVKTATMAANYIQVAKQYMTKQLNSHNFRIGVGNPSQVLEQWSANNAQ